MDQYHPTEEVWVSKDCNGFTSLRDMVGRENSCHAGVEANQVK